MNEMNRQTAKNGTVITQASLNSFSHSPSLLTLI